MGDNSQAKGLGSMKHTTTEGLNDRDELLDDPKRIAQYRAVGLAE
jgi:hypothetical protein